MTPAAFRAARKQLGLSQNALAQLLRVASARTIRRWEKGEREIPGPAVVLMLWLIGGKSPLISDRGGPVV